MVHTGSYTVADGASSNGKVSAATFSRAHDTSSVVNALVVQQNSTVIPFGSVR